MAPWADYWTHPEQTTLLGYLTELCIRKIKSDHGEVSKVTRSCPTLCDPMDCSLPGSSVYGIFQAGIQEWVAISCWCVNKSTMCWAPPCARSFRDIISSPPEHHVLCTPHTAWNVAVEFWIWTSLSHSPTFISHFLCIPLFCSIEYRQCAVPCAMWIIMCEDP